MMLRMEDTRAVSGWIGAQELLLGHVRTVEDAVAEMDAVTIEDLQRVAREIIDPRRAYLADRRPLPQRQALRRPSSRRTSRPRKTPRQTAGRFCVYR